MPKYFGGRPTKDNPQGLQNCPNCTEECLASSADACDTCCWSPNGVNSVCRANCNNP